MTNNTNKSDWPTRPIKVDDETWQNGEMVARILGQTWGGRGNVSGAVRLLLGMTEGQARAVGAILTPTHSFEMDGIKLSRSLDGTWLAQIIAGEWQGYYYQGQTADEAIEKLKQGLGIE